MTILYDVNANSLQLPDAEWKTLLSVAADYGWNPRGTEAPPPPLPQKGRASDRQQWDGRYEDAAGQLVRFDDAKGLGEALRRAVGAGTAISSRFESAVQTLSDWSKRGGFLVCRPTPDVMPMPDTAAQLSALNSSLSSFPTVSPSEPRPEVAGRSVMAQVD